MASSQCWKCLTRPSTSTSTSVSTSVSASTSNALLSRTALRGAAPFSTTSILAKNPLAKKKPDSRLLNKNLKGNRTLKIKGKGPPVRTGKPPASGERKAMRKRVVLSNTNALEVEGMGDLDVGEVERLCRDKGEGEGEGKKGGIGNGEVVGRVVGLMGSTVDSLRAAEAFKTTQGWGLFRRPGVLIREESVLVTRKLVDAERGSTVRLVVDGDRVTGKSMMLVHAMATAFVRGWIVLNIPEAQDITTAATDYAPIPGTTLWSQNTYAANWLSQIRTANLAVLDSLTLQQQHSLPIPIQSNITLARLCELGARDPDVAWPLFQAFWSEITAKGQPPILMCLDSVSNIMGKSMYRAPDFSLIHAHDLAIVRHFIDFFSGEKDLPNGGAFLAATNRSHAPVSKSMNLAIKRSEQRAKGEDLTKPDPFEKDYDERTEKAMQKMEVLRLKGLSKKEARGLMEYWAKSGVLRSRVDEREVAEKWALAGNGVVGEIERGALMMRI